MPRQIKLRKFRDLTIGDPFFDSLKSAYREFGRWFASKADEDVYVIEENGLLSGMIYLKPEFGPVNDVQPPLQDMRWLKVGTLKVVGKGTRLGERVLKKIFDTAISVGADGVYVTVFEVHDDLIRLFERYGFRREAIKNTANGTELVLVRKFSVLTGDLHADYPLIHTRDRQAWLLAIYPEYHTRLLPDSILRGEPSEMVQDVSHTNTIHKIYVARLNLLRMSPGDIVLFYRTSDNKGPAHYRSVVSSICVVEDVRGRNAFPTLADYVKYAGPGSVFDEAELKLQYQTWSRLYVAKLTYNAALSRRVTRGALLDAGILSVQPRWDLRLLETGALADILKLGEVNARLIVD